MYTFKPTLRQRARLLVTQPRLAFAAAVPSLTFYGGATITAAHDATGAEFVACCAKNLATGQFGLYVLRDGVATQIAPLVSGRGSVWISLFDGTARWVGWDGSTRAGGPIPGFAPFPSLMELAEKIAALAGIVAGLPPTITGSTIRVPAQGGAEGGEIQLATGDGGGPWCIDVYAGTLRLHRNGVVYERWPK
jgi:hypothetical protein